MLQSPRTSVCVSNTGQISWRGHVHRTETHPRLFRAVSLRQVDRDNCAGDKKKGSKLRRGEQRPGLGQDRGSEAERGAEWTRACCLATLCLSFPSCVDHHSPHFLGAVERIKTFIQVLPEQGPICLSSTFCFMGIFCFTRTFLYCFGFFTM